MDVDDPKFNIDETVYLHTQMAIPSRSKSKLIIPLDTISYTYLFKDHDINILLKYVDKKELNATLFLMKNEKKLNPCTNQIYPFKFLLTFIFAILYLIFLYVSLGIVIITLFNPIVIITAVYSQLKFVKKISGIRLLLIQKRKMKDLKQFLSRENERYYSAKRIEWSLGDKANWVQIDIKKGFLSNRPRHNSPKKTIN